MSLQRSPLVGAGGLSHSGPGICAIAGCLGELLDSGRRIVRSRLLLKRRRAQKQSDKNSGYPDPQRTFAMVGNLAPDMLFHAVCDANLLFEFVAGAQQKGGTGRIWVVAHDKKPLVL